MLTRHAMAAIAAFAAIAVLPATAAAQCPGSWGYSHYNQPAYGNWSAAPYAGQSAWGGQAYYNQQAGYAPQTAYGAHYGPQYSQYGARADVRGDRFSAQRVNVSGDSDVRMRADSGRINTRVSADVDRAQSARAYQAGAQYGQQAYGYSQNIAGQARDYGQSAYNYNSAYAGNAYGSYSGDAYGTVNTSSYAGQNMDASFSGSVNTSGATNISY